MTKFNIHPRVLAEALDNAVVIGKDKPAITYCDVIGIEGFTDRLEIYARGRYTAGRVTVPVHLGWASPKTTCILEAEAAELASVLKKVEGAGRKGTVVEVTLDGGLAIRAGTETICDLADADPDGDEYETWHEIDGAIALAEHSLLVGDPLAFSKDLIARFTKIKAETDVLDMVCIGGNTVVAKMGENFHGLIEAVAREGYATGGPWGDGPGKPEHLLKNKN